MGALLMGGDDLTIDQRKAVLFPQPGKTNIEVVKTKKEKHERTI